MQDKVTRCLGLTTQYNPLGLVPGALAKANDCMIRRENIIENRRGHAVYTAATLTSSTVARSWTTYQDRVVLSGSGKMFADDALYTGDFNSNSASVTPPRSGDNKYIRFAQASQKLFSLEYSGVMTRESVGALSTYKRAGVPRSLDPSYALTGASGFLANNYQCAYRICYKKIDGFKNIIRGYPSQRMHAYNAAGGSRNTSVTIYFPTTAAIGLAAENVIEVYRTEQSAYSGTDSAGDEMYLVYSYTLTSSDISAGYLTFTDSIIDGLMGFDLYTNATQEGIGQANAIPPVASDMCLYKNNYMLYANTRGFESYYFALVGTSGLSGKTITLGEITYNFGATEIISGGGSPQALVSATGVAAVDIDLTARSLVKVINRYASNTSWYAYYLSGADDTPGQIRLESRVLYYENSAGNYMTASDSTIGGMFSPVLPTSSYTSETLFSLDVRKNGISFSKENQPEHVPLLNYVLVGPSNTEILRIVSLRDSVIVIKEEGVYRLTGESPSSFQIVPIDLTVRCKAKDSVVVLENQVFMLSNQGVVSISESGVQVISHDIEPNIQPILASSYLYLSSACAYDSERSYYLSTLSDTTHSVPDITYVYNVATKTWVKHSYAFVSAYVDYYSDRMYFSKNATGEVYKERKDYTTDDYADPEHDITITAVVDDYVEFTISASVTPLVGWVIKQSYAEVAINTLEVIVGGYRAYITDEIPASLAAGAADLFPSVLLEIEWHPWTAGVPEKLKQISSAAILSDDLRNDSSASELIFKFRSNYLTEFEEVEIEQDTLGWGGLWGSSPWGGGADTGGYVTFVPLNAQYATRLGVGIIHKRAREKINIAGFALAFRVASESMGR